MFDLRLHRLEGAYDDAVDRQNQMERHCFDVQEIATDIRFRGEDWQIELLKAHAIMLQALADLEDETQMARRAMQFEQRQAGHREYVKPKEA